jgi:hypothetical protein
LYDLPKELDSREHLLKKAADSSVTGQTEGLKVGFKEWEVKPKVL